MFLNLGPQHPGTHGVLRIVLQLRRRRDRRRDSRHRLPPPRRREDGRAPVVAHLYPVHRPRRLSRRRDEQPAVPCSPSRQLAGIEVPDRVKVIRIMLCELFRIASHLVWYGTFAQDLGALSPVFYMFTDRERLFGIIEAICGGAHASELVPHRRRRAGSAQRLGPAGRRLRRVSAAADARVRHAGHAEPHFQDAHAGRRRLHARTRRSTGASPARCCARAASSGTSARSGRTRATSSSSSTSRRRQHGDCYDRAVVRVEEMRQSLRIIEQCVKQHAAGPVQVARIRWPRRRSRSGRCTTSRR